jgi:hypothetical protein
VNDYFDDDETETDPDYPASSYNDVLATILGLTLGLIFVAIVQHFG